MPNNFQHGASAASENKKIARVWVPAECFLNLKRKPVHPSPHVRPPNSQPDPRTRRNRNHDRTSALTTAAARSGEAETGSRTWVRIPT